MTSHPSPSKLIRRLLGVAWRYRGPSLIVLALNGLTVVVGVMGLGLTGLGIDFIRHEVQAGSPPPKWPFGWSVPTNWSPLAVVAGIALCIFATAVLAALLRFATAIANASLSQRVLIQLRSDVYDKLQRLSFGFYDANSGSSLINRAASDVQAVRTFVDGVIVKVLVVGLTLCVYLGYMLSVHVGLTVACLATLPLLWVLSIRFSRDVQPEYSRASRLIDDLVLTVVENVEGQHVVKGFARQPEEIAKFDHINQAVYQQKRGIFWRLSVYQPLTGLITQFNLLVLLSYGGYLVIDGRMQLGVGLFVFANLLQEFANQVGQITNIANTIQTSLTGAERVFEVLDAPIEVCSPPDPLPLPPRNLELPKQLKVSRHMRPTGRKVRFDRVDFAYPSRNDEASRLVLKQVSFVVNPGQRLGIVGETGSGKTTILSLLERFYDVTAGSISIDGVDVRQLDLDELRRNIGIVFQESFLFSHTVRANISFGNVEATDADIHNAAALAMADEFIRELPQGYDTLIGEFGANLSGGQRQRLAIARALLLDPPILVLDDATAAVDAETEHEIHSALDGAAQGRTTIVVSNRMSMLRRMDQVIVLREGRVVQSGPPDQLLQQPGIFRHLAELQYADQLNEVLAKRAAAG